ncbi:MAG: NotI family restriction endonuclease [Verrucomicrobiae bacterium]|nr:NotI family restriction endonuclease [Verrucomicrobiae bacterium]
MPKPKYPSEIFGYPYYNTTPTAQETRAKHWCPFVNKACCKQSRLINYPFGVCTAHVNDEEIALCPRRFLDGHTVFTDIAQHCFHTTNDILVFSEVGLTDIGNFDFVMVKHKPMSSEIEDFAAIEFQTGQTTNTGKLVQGLKDFMAGQIINYKPYGFGVNFFDIWKRTFAQVLNKGVIMEIWKKKIYWVVQEPVYKFFEAKYNLQHLAYKPQHSTVFALYDLVPERQSFALKTSRKISASMDQLFDAFRTNPNIPPLEKFLSGLKRKIETQAQISLHLGRPS